MHPWASKRILPNIINDNFLLILFYFFYGSFTNNFLLNGCRAFITDFTFADNVCLEVVGGVNFHRSVTGHFATQFRNVYTESHDLSAAGDAVFTFLGIPFFQVDSAGAVDAALQFVYLEVIDNHIGATGNIQLQFSYFYQFF